MKKFTCCFILLLCSFYTHAQSSQKLDSLKKVLAKLPKEGASFAGDTTRVRVLCEMGEFEQALLSIGRINSDKFVTIAYNRIGNLMENNQNFYKVGEILFKALTFAEKSKDDLLLAETHLNIGKNYYNLKNYTLCREHILKAKDIYNRIKAYYGVLNAIKIIGNSYIEEKENKKALIWYKLCMQLSNQYKIYSIKPNILGNIAIAYEQENMLDSALIYNQKAVNEIELSFPNNLVTKVSCLIEIAYIYLLKKDYKKTINYGKNALIICEEKNLNLKSFAHRVLYKGYAGNKQFELAFENLIEYQVIRDSLELIKKDQQVKSIKSDYENELSKNKLLLKDKDLENKNLQRNLFAILGAVFLMIAIGFWFTKNKISQQKNKIELQNIEINKVKLKLEDLNSSLEEKVEVRTTELKQANIDLQRKNEEISRALVEGQTIERKRVAIELHDNLGGMLSGMKFRLQALDKNKLTEKEQKIYEGILSMMGDAYSEVRLISHNLLPAELEKSGLIGAIQKLIDDINVGEKLNIDFIHNNIGKIDIKLSLELYSVCMELVNNIIKHSQANNATIIIKCDSKFIYLDVYDNGIGMEKGKNEGFGVKNLKNRLDSLGGEIYFKDVNKGTNIIIKVPLKNTELVNA